MTQTRTGACHCGAIRYTATGEPQHHALCHCTDCRRWSGAPMVGWIAFTEDQVTVTGTPATYASSADATRQFCATCGTGLFYRNPVYLPGIVDIQSGTLDDYTGNPPGAQIMVKDRVAWMDEVDALPRFATYPGMD
ncbi:GFA family protein [Sphingomonas mollis]|uniref:GFA family protein n=1 Tax=Sphingomonas mollis TaxID=2795726 RepID=A0ABS0XMI1_9SPHN|nr:GFA family protein [Sphingomonas sp. BT553]MBJ6120948.1 GFA family protein [Sphingomonas sp. BT553]